MERARVVLVTNVGQGFGRAVALAYGRAGYHVVCADRDVDLASKTAAEVEELGGQAIPIQADMTTQMDVLTTYQKVLEIFGALGGVVHLAPQSSSVPFESITESEFYDVVAENVRSTFLVLKTAARLLSLGWVVVVAPPALDAVQMMTVQGALEKMVLGFRQRFSHPRVNLVLPSRASSDPRHDQALVRAVRYLGSHESVGVSGQLVDVDLPEPPQVTETLLPEVRAALDINVRQDDDYPYAFGGSFPTGPNGHGGRYEDDDILMDDHQIDTGDDDGRFDDQDDDRHDYQQHDDQQHDDDQHGDHDDDHAEYAAFDLHWSQEFGLRSGPALRHVIGDDNGAFDGGRNYEGERSYEGEQSYDSEQNYAAGLEPAVDLYGDLTRLESEGASDYPGGFADDEDRPDSVIVGSNLDAAKKRR